MSNSKKSAKEDKAQVSKQRKLEKKLEDLEQQVETLTEDVKRERADFMNYKRRSEIDRMNVMETATTSVVTDLLPVFDDLERALSATPDDIADHPWVKGVMQVHKQVQTKLADLGVERIECQNQPFDPDFHEAVGFEDGSGEDEVVVEELRPGYKRGGTTLRPSMVKVGKRLSGNKNPKQEKNKNNIKEDK